MFYVSEITTEAPREFKTPLQEKIYTTLAELGIAFERVENDPGISMEDCKNIDKVLGGEIVKTVFLCNRQQTLFYIYAMKPDKPFITKDFGQALGISRVSFANAEKLAAIAGVEHGAATVLASCLGSTGEVRFILDRDVAEAEKFCCTDGTATCFLKLDTADVLRFIRETGHEPELI